MYTNEKKSHCSSCLQIGTFILLLCGLIVLGYGIYLVVVIHQTFSYITLSIGGLILILSIFGFYSATRRGILRSCTLGIFLAGLIGVVAGQIALIIALIIKKNDILKYIQPESARHYISQHIVSVGYILGGLCVIQSLIIFCGFMSGHSSIEFDNEPLLGIYTDSVPYRKTGGLFTRTGSEKDYGSVENIGLIGQPAPEG